jgi:transglutaminase/protease-like cytokinesis protein 3
MRFAGWIIKATNTHTEICSIYCFSTVKMFYANAPKCFVIRTLHVSVTQNAETHTHFGQPFSSIYCVLLPLRFITSQT